MSKEIRGWTDNKTTHKYYKVCELFIYDQT